MTRLADWDSRAAAIIAYADTHDGRFPAPTDLDDDGAEVGRWFVELRRRSRGNGYGPMPTSAVQTLDDLDPDWPRTRRTRTPAEWARLIVAQAKADGRMPTAASTDARGRHVGWWLVELRRRARGTSYAPLDPEAARILDEQDPGWRTPYPWTHVDWARAIVAYATTHGRLPASAARDDEDRPVARWLAKLRARARGDDGLTLDPAAAAVLDEHDPGWRVGRVPGRPRRS